MMLDWYKVAVACLIRVLVIITLLLGVVFVLNLLLEVLRRLP